MKYKGIEIGRLIPQRNPMMMVDEFEATAENVAQTALLVRVDNLFMLPDGTLTETGLIEHIAQSAAALAGYQTLSEGQPRIGLIGEVKHFECHRRPMAGEVVHTVIEFGFSFGNVTVVQGHCHIADEEIASAKLKIFMQ
ncbi:MAG: beta-hydroxyacyl-ACP dehydratase [Prevotella sp.]|nr:beta-hydroxyacyl-ACP dehydratase [Prevotella sp.]